MTRRQFLPTGGLTALALTRSPLGAFAAANAPRPAPARAMTIDLVPGNIGVSADLGALIDLAAKHGFESIEPPASALARLSSERLRALGQDMRTRGLKWGATGLPVDFRRGDSEFREGLNELPALMAGLQRAGANRVGTWISPAHPSLTYLQNFKTHARRLREVAQILKDHGQRFGLEYVGTQRSRLSRKYPFVHTMAETRELITEIGLDHVGLVLDSWHWWTAEDTVEEVLALRNEDVVAVDLNDAPVGIAREEQVDGRRELPASTGVIDPEPMIQALIRIGYDGPVRAEPFNQALNGLDNEAACAATSKALHKAFAQSGAP